MSTLAISWAANPDWVERLDRAARAITESARAVRAAVLHEKAVVGFFLAVRSLNQHATDLLDSMDEGVRKIQSGEMVLHDPDSGTDPKAIVATLERCYKILNGLYILATFAGLKGRTLTRPAVKQLRVSAEKLLDYVQWLEEAISDDARERAEKSFSEGVDELEAGETVAFSL